MQKDIRENHKETVVLFHPTKESIDYYKTYFFQSYTVPQLRELADTLYPLIKKAEVEISGARAGSQTEKTIDLFKEKKNVASKDLLASFLSIFVGDVRNLSYYVKSLPFEFQKMLELVTKNYFMSDTTIKKEVGKSLVVELNSLRYSREVKSQIPWINCIKGKPDGYDASYHWYSEYYFFIDIPIRVMFMQIFMNPKEYEIEIIKELPGKSDKPLQTFKADPIIFTELPILDGLTRQGLLTIGDNLKMQVSIVKKLAGQMKMVEFFPDCQGQISYLRASLILPVYAALWNISKKKQIDQPEKRLKEIFQNEILSFSTFLLPILLPHIGGFRSNDIRKYLRLDLVRDVIVFILSVADMKGNEGWINTQQLFNNYMMQGHPVTLFPYFHINDMSLKNKIHDYPVYLDRSYEEVTVTFYKAFLFLLSSFGLVEIAYEGNDASAPSPFSSLRYYRFTRLGLYVFGQADSYEVPEAENKDALFELDENNLIVRSLTDDNPYEGLLAEMAEPIGRKRYKITHASLLNSCNTRKDVADKVEFFKRFISDKLPKVWDEFFQSLVQRCRPLKGLEAGKYVIYELDSSNRDLLQLVSTDPEIRKYTVRAEGYLLLVETAHLKKVTTRLKFFGYLL